MAQVAIAMSPEDLVEEISENGAVTVVGYGHPEGKIHFLVLRENN